MILTLFALHAIKVIKYKCIWLQSLVTFCNIVVNVFVDFASSYCGCAACARNDSIITSSKETTSSRTQCSSPESSLVNKKHFWEQKINESKIT